LNYIKEHAYLPKNIFRIYRIEVNPPTSEYKNIKNKFIELIHYHLKYRVLERYSYNTYRINKEMVV